MPPTAQIATAPATATAIATAAAATSRLFPSIGILPTTTAPTPTTVLLPRTTPTPANTATPASVVTATTAPKTSVAVGTYRDGSYVGLGRSRHGNIEVTVAVQGGKITAAKISQCLTRYPCSMIGALPGEVVAQQSATVDFVSGATDSSTAFKDAVTNALAKAS